MLSVNGGLGSAIRWRRCLRCFMYLAVDGAHLYKCSIFWTKVLNIVIFSKYFVSRMIIKKKTGLVMLEEITNTI